MQTIANDLLLLHDDCELGCDPFFLFVMVVKYGEALLALAGAPSKANGRPLLLGKGSFEKHGLPVDQLIHYTVNSK
jgi:hypothetical protein